jgi:hypothetical protein
MWIYSNDNLTIEQRRRELPAKHWEVTGPNEGRYHELTPANAAGFGWSELVETPRPDADHVRTVVHNGSGWVETWTHDADLAAANAAAVVDEVERDAIRGMLSALTDIVQAESMTNTQQTAALKKLARVARRLVKDSL